MSTLQVDTIQKTNGSAPTLADLSIDHTDTIVQVKTSHIGGSAIAQSSSTMTSLGSLAITPKFSNSKILIQVLNHIYIPQLTADSWRGALIEIKRDSTILETDTGKYGESANFTENTDRIMIYSSRLVVDTPSTTSSVTYSILGGSLSSEVALNFNNPDYGTQAKMTLMEIKQ